MKVDVRTLRSLDHRANLRGHCAKLLCLPLLCLPLLCLPKILAATEDNPPHIESPLLIHLEQPHGGSPSRRRPLDVDSILAKVVPPDVGPGVEKQNDLARLWINAGQIRTLL